MTDKTTVETTAPDPCPCDDPDCRQKAERAKWERGLWSLLTPAQRAAILDYDGPESHGPQEFRL